MKRLPALCLGLTLTFSPAMQDMSSADTQPRKPRKPRTPQPVEISRDASQLRDAEGDGGRGRPAVDAQSPRVLQTPAPSPTAQPSTTLDTNAVGRQIARLWPYDDRQALSVADCESGDYDGLPPYVPTANATGKAAERGPFQIHPTHANDLLPRLGLTWGQMYDVGPNVAAAIALYEDRGGWGHWTCKPK